MPLSAERPVAYNIDLSSAREHLIEVQASYFVAGTRELELYLPAWTPGSYLVREYARQIESIRVIGDDGQPEPATLKKMSKDAWLIRWSTERETIQIAYRVYAREKSVRTNWVEPDFCFLTGAATFITSEAFRTHPHSLLISGLKEHSDLVSSLAVDTEHKPDRATHSHALVAKDFDELVDSPLLIGKLAIEKFEVAGVQHRLVGTSDASYWDHAGAALDGATVVREVIKFWRHVPYRQYDFQNLILGGYGGLEHDNCTVLMTERWTMYDRKSYVDWLGLVCHEFFHTWNVRRLRPRALKKYDYRKEQHFSELWIAEGITSYFDDLLVYRAGLCNQAEYLERLSRQLRTVITAPGRLVQSLAESSFDTWIKLYRPDENAANARISYYNKGALVAWLLDVRIRKLTGNVRSLDDVMRTLWERYLASGYTCENFETVVAEIAPDDWQPWFDKHIRSAEELDFSEAFEYLGLQVISSVASEAALQALAFVRQVPSGNTPEELPNKTRVGAGVLGCETRTQDGRAVISKITRGGAASLAGLQVDDELVAINGIRVSSSGVNSMLSRFMAGAEIEVSYFRRETLSTAKVCLAESASEWKLELNSAATASAVENRISWLG